MNILYLTNHLNIGGITSYVFSLATALRRKGHNIYIASSGGSLLPKFIEEGIIFIPIPIRTKQEVSPKVLFSMLKLQVTVKKNRIDLLHSNSRTTQVLGCLLNHSLGVPHISTCHGFFKKRISRRLFPCWGERVVAISQAVKAHLIDDFKVDKKKIILIPNGIDLREFTIRDTQGTIQKKKELGLGNGPVVGIIARLSEEKGHCYLIRAMQEVISRYPLAQLLIVGEGRMKEELLNLTRALGLEKNIFFIPPVIGTEAILSVMDVFVLPSSKEGLGLALMEAMAYALPVIGSRVGGITSLIQDGCNGLLVNPGDILGLSLAILKLLQNPDKAKALGGAARIFIGQNFSQEKMALETEKLYLECLGAKN